MRLDRLLCQNPKWNRRKALTLLAQGEVLVDGNICTDALAEIRVFNQVIADGQLLQQGKSALYLMLNKPAGVVTATEDPEHPTIMALLPSDIAPELHFAGRLDKSSTGLVLLTNDGQWSRRVTCPKQKIPKTYVVTTAKDIHPETAERFAQGIHFPYEDVTTSPAELIQLSERCARLTIYEGRYHQIKRMFGRFRNPVVALHRESMGAIKLDTGLSSGQWRSLTREEVSTV